MSTLCMRLQDVNAAGAYRLNCPLEELRAAAAQAGFALFEADLTGVQGKGEFLAAVAQALTAPEWFGNNWDALADALGDLSWHPPASGYVLLLNNSGDTPGLSDADHGVIAEIFADTVSFWKSHGRPFWVFYC